ncbi:MAG: response regulator [Pseudomonadota bacterium]
MARNALLVVDADTATARRVTRALDGADVEVRVARDLPAALEAANRDGAVVALVAVSLPGASGYDLARRLRDETPWIAVYMLWGGFEVLDERRVAEVGACGSLRRPLSADAVLAVVENAIGAVPVASADLQPVEDTEETLPVGSFEPLDGADSRSPPEDDALVPLLGTERLAAFIPGDYKELPVVRIDREEVSVALERAVLAVLPETVEAVLERSMGSPGSLRRVVEEAVERAVAEQLPAALERALRERLG